MLNFKFEENYYVIIEEERLGRQMLRQYCR